MPSSSITVLWLALPLATSAPVGEGEFLAPLLADHAAVRALDAGVARAEGALATAGALENPVAGFDREQPESGPHQNTWSLAWTPPLDGRRGLARDAARAGLHAEVARRDGLRLERRLELRRVYANWSLGHARAERLREDAERVAALERRLRLLAERGEASGLAARRMRLAHRALLGELAVAEAERDRATAAARSWRPDLPPEARPEGAELPTVPAPDPGVERPEVRALRQRVEQARFERRLSDRFWRFPELRFGWQTLRSGEIDDSGPVFGVQWSVPLFDRQQGARLAASALEDVAAARLTLAEQRAEAERQGRLAAYARLREAAVEGRRDAADAGTVVDATQAALLAGEADVTDVLEALRAVRELRLQQLELWAAALEAHRELERAVGRALEGGR